MAHITENKIDSVVFGPNKHFRSLAIQCKTINIPICDGNHWYLCTLDMDKQRIVISDTNRVSVRDEPRKFKAKLVVMYLLKHTLLSNFCVIILTSQKRKHVCFQVDQLEKVVGLWECEAFEHFNWTSTFKCVHSTVPQQDNRYDSTNFQLCATYCEILIFN